MCFLKCLIAGCRSALLSYRGGNAPDKPDVLGTLVLAMLAGRERYAHITALRDYAAMRWRHRRWR